MNSSKEIAELLEKYDSWTLLCHEKPDGDTIGSALSLYILGKRLGKKVVVGGKDILPVRYAFLPCTADYRKMTDNDVPDNSLLLCIDTSTKARSIENIEQLVKKHESINIDHHGDNELYCKYNLVDDSASATAEIVTRLILERWKISKDEAICLYTALVTDNGDFRFSSVTAQSHRIAEILLEAGADQAEIDDRLNENMTEGSLKLWGYALSRVQLFIGGKVAICCVTSEDFAKYNSLPSDMENFVNQLLRIKGVKIALFVCEHEGKIKLSIRTRVPYSARHIASIFGGGGHINAAGAALKGEFCTAVEELKSKVEEYVSSL